MQGPSFLPNWFSTLLTVIGLTGWILPGSWNLCLCFGFCLCFLPLYVETLGPGGGGCSRGWFWQGEGSQAASLRKQTAPFSHPSPLHLLICHLFSSSSPSWLHQLSLGERWIDPLLKHGIKKGEDMTAQTIYSNVETYSNTGCFFNCSSQSSVQWKGKWVTSSQSSCSIKFSIFNLFVGFFFVLKMVRNMGARVAETLCHLRTISPIYPPSHPILPWLPTHPSHHQHRDQCHQT